MKTKQCKQAALICKKLNKRCAYMLITKKKNKNKLIKSKDKRAVKSVLATETLKAIK